MSKRELDRAQSMLLIRERRRTQAEVAEQLGLTLRQVERLYPAYKAGGAAALASTLERLRKAQIANDLRKLTETKMTKRQQAALKVSLVERATPSELAAVAPAPIASHRRSKPMPPPREQPPHVSASRRP